jgi:hypothetical protein
VINWLRSSSFQNMGFSRIWSGLIKSIHLINHGLFWIPGRGTQIVLGKDRILGMGNSSFLSTNLINALHLRNVKTLAQVSSPSEDWVFSFHTGKVAENWGSQVNWTGNGNSLDLLLLIRERSVIDKEDSLSWAGGDDSGVPTVKNFYMSIIRSKNLNKVEVWKTSIWKWNVPLKIKLFLWLAMEGKILTWESLQRRGWEGPGRCPLCRMDLETISHLFISCTFTRQVWDTLVVEFKLKCGWVGTNLSEGIKLWTEDFSASPQFPALCLLEYLA